MNPKATHELITDIKIVPPIADSNQGPSKPNNAAKPVKPKGNGKKTLPWILLGALVTLGSGVMVMFFGVVFLMSAANSVGGGGYSSGGFPGDGTNGIRRYGNRGWIDHNGWGTPHTSGSVDPNGNNSVYSVDGEVLNLPPY